MSALRKWRVIEGGAGRPDMTAPTPVARERLHSPTRRRDFFAVFVALAVIGHAIVIGLLLPAERFGGIKATGETEAIEIEAIDSNPGEAPASRGASLAQAGEVSPSDAVVRPESETKPVAAVDNDATAKAI